MEYKINNFNLSDIIFSNNFSLSSYIESSVLKQNIKNLLIGPNIISFKYTNEKKIAIEENKKIINTVCRLLLHNLSAKEQTLILNSTSNYSSKSFIKKVFKELESLIEDKMKVDNKQEIFQSFVFFDFLSFFTAVKDEFNDEISLCDYIMSFNYEEGLLKFNMIETLHNNIEVIYDKSSSTNNLHIFYMLLYNIPVEDLRCYLICDKTNEYFNIFSDKLEVENFIRRYVFINQFNLLKNKKQFEELSKSDSNVNQIKKEFEFYKSMYSNYSQIKEILGIDEENERKIFEVFFSIILLSEYDIVKDNLAENVIEKTKYSTFNSQLEMMFAIKNIIASDYRFRNNSKVKSYDLRNNERFNILQKLSMNMNLPEEKIVFLLLMDNEKLKLSSEFSSKMKNYLIKGVYLNFVDKIKFIFENYDSNNNIKIQNKSNNINSRGNVNKLNIIISRSNLVYSSIFLKDFASVNNTQESESKEFIIDKNIREVIFSNYTQELKNFLYLRNSLNITSSIKEFTWPNISYNENFINKLMGEFYNFPQILDLYENTSGLFKALEDVTNFSLFKQKFSKLFVKKNIIEIIDQKYLKVKHTFGTFLYEMNELFKEINSYKKNFCTAEETIYNFLDYKPTKDYKVNFETNIKLLKRLLNGVVYNSYLVKVNKYKISEVVEDFKLDNIHYFYNNFFNYIVNMKDIRENLVKYKKLVCQLSKDDYSLFKTVIAKKIRISNYDFFLENGYAYCRNNFNRVMDFNRNISNLIFKYNHKMFYYLIVKKVSVSDFSYFRFAINAVRAFVKLTKIYQEKKAFKNVKNMITDLIVEHYNVDENSMISELDQLPQFNFDFSVESLITNLPKLYANLQLLKKTWKNFITDIIYLDRNKSNFVNSTQAETIINDRLANFKCLLFLFSKKFEFTNFDLLKKKNGILHSVFTQNIANEVMNLMRELFILFRDFLVEHEFKLRDKEDMNLEKLVTRRVSLLKEQHKRNSFAVDKIASNEKFESAKKISSDSAELNELVLKSGRDFSFKNMNKHNPVNSDSANNCSDGRTFTVGNFDNSVKDSRLDKLEKFVNNRYVLTQDNNEHNEPQKKTVNYGNRFILQNILKKNDEESLYLDNNEKVNLKRLSENFGIVNLGTNNNTNNSFNPNNASFMSKNEMNENSFFGNKSPSEKIIDISVINKKADEALDISFNNSDLIVFKKTQRGKSVDEVKRFEKISVEDAGKYSSHQTEDDSDGLSTQRFLSNKDFNYVKKVDSLKSLNQNHNEYKKAVEINNSNGFEISNENQIFIKSDYKESFEEDVNEIGKSIYTKKKVNLKTQKNKKLKDEDTEYNSLNAMKKSKVQQINLNQLLELDKQLEILKREISSLDLIDAITESTSHLCFSKDVLLEKENEVLGKKISEDFYFDIQKELLEAANNLSKNLI